MAMADSYVESALAELLEIACAAIEMGDWTVDGRCDPDTALNRAADVLRNSGWTQNSIDGSWFKEPAP